MPPIDIDTTPAEAVEPVDTVSAGLPAASGAGAVVISEDDELEPTIVRGRE
ncbi:hypothetical protein [Saccharomonospora piscinae]|uniref:hypothetical protein n=1 Tax=Saccharomonospora piscinae TaxID=687388 RepID=UPI0004AF41B3|nr:hypothetical protein [Saccharomonospora piscinae]